MDKQLDRATKRIKAERDDLLGRVDAEIEKCDIEEKRLKDKLQYLEEKKKNSAAAHGSASATDDDLIEVNAGGKIIAAKRGVMCQKKGTRLEGLFSGRWDKKLLKDGSGRIFLDVNPKAFRTIVDYLNELAISAEDEQPDLPYDNGGELIQFFTYFGLHHRFFNSNIIKKPSHFDTIHQWLKEDGSDGDLKLIYRTSRDGLSNQMFHNECDNVGPTCIVLETDEGHVLGGYSNTPWQSSGGYMTADKAFLFALHGFGITSPIKMKLNDSNEYAIEANSSYGPIFGDHDHEDTMLVCLDEDSSYIRLESGGAYEDTPWQGEECSIKEMEVYQVAGGQRSLNSAKKPPTVDRFTKDVNEAINEKWTSLFALEQKLASLEENLKDEEEFIESLSGGDRQDIITLNVSGTVMATKRATLMIAEDSVLAQQFDDTKWTEQRSNLQVKEWAPDDVMNWVKNIEGVPDNVASLFQENEINGIELLALDKDGLKMIGVDRVGTICLLFDGIKSLKEKVNQTEVTLIEHSPYCFGKILDYLRLKRLQSINLAEEPALPTVCESQQTRFEKVVKYYFPGESSSFILGPPREN
ncbi:hypothetical protein ACHAWT_002900 [Skeletonema menzelii]|eukprot:scaffold304_cov80-Skeletonema_menzelii.AAC.13